MWLMCGVRIKMFCISVKGAVNVKISYLIA